MTPAQVPVEAWLLFAAPVAAILIGFFVMRPLKPEWTHWPILVSCLIVTASALALLAPFLHPAPGVLSSFDVTVWRWAATGKWGVDFGLRVDGISASVLAMVAVVGSLIHVYAAGYMKGDAGFSRFFLVFHLFFLAMIGLLLSNNFVQLYLFWEMVGVASYLLVGFWYHKESARKAALKAFLTNRVGDFGFLLALLYILVDFKVGHFNLIYAQLAHPELYSPAFLPAIGLGLIWAACAKSAQFPLYFWLPDAMEGPTPTSALMHAATMVTAGVFLLVRSWPLISAVPWLPPLVAGIGCFTAVSSAIVAATKRDLKRILAYSTVSHLGLMMLALGLGRVSLAVFHLIVHGFFKAVLFLCAGNIGHAIHKPSASVDEVGGWRKALPWTYACFVLAALSLAGVWPFGGFFSKDAILDAAWEHGGWIKWVSQSIAFGSAFYISRMLLLTFHGERKEQAGLKAHPHEAEFVLVAPVFLLALGALGIGFLGRALELNMFAGMHGIPAGLKGFAPLNLPGELDIPALRFTDMFGRGGLLAALGFASAWWLTMKDAGFDWRWRRSSPLLETAFESDFGWKPLVALFVDGVSGAALFAGRVLDKKWWDGVIEGTADASAAVGGHLASYSQGRLNDALWWMAAAAAILLGGALGAVK